MNIIRKIPFVRNFMKKLSTKFFNWAWGLDKVTKTKSHTSKTQNT